jgi:hypothetical protein
VLAREVTALDVLSSGRAAVCLQGEGERLAEAVAVCRLLFAGAQADYEGAHFHLHEAVNLPGPVGRPRLLVQAPGPVPELAPDGWVVTGDPEEVARWRQRGVTAPVLWRGTVREDLATLASSLLAAGADGLIVQVGATPDEVAEVGRHLT